MKQCQWFVILLMLCTGLLASQSAFAFRCSGGLVTEGDSKLSVRDKCGEPSWVDRWVEEIIELPDTDFEHRVTRINERWVYNPGPAQFLRIVSFRDSKVIDIDIGGRGFTSVPGWRRCDFNVLSLGVTSAEVAGKCGEPDMKDRRFETVTEKMGGGRKQITVTVDEWTFNLGPTSFIRILTFRNGNLVKIETGEKGFR